MASDETNERTSTPCETVREENEENVAKNEPKLDRRFIEKKEEEKLKSKYPNLARGGGGSALLNKRLQKGGQKYFDSGDYAMAKAKMSKSKPHPPPENIIKQEAVGETIPTPENIQARKPSLVTSKLVSGSELL